MESQKLSKPVRIISWILQIVVAFVLLQTIPFKFLGAAIPGGELSVKLFTVIGAEPWGRYVVGLMELIGGVFILWPRYIWFGAAVSFFVMLGAVLTHLFKIGIVVHDAAGNVVFGPDLFIQATVAMVFAAIVFVIRRKSSPFVGSRL